MNKCKALIVKVGTMHGIVQGLVKAKVLRCGRLKSQGLTDFGCPFIGHFGGGLLHMHQDMKMYPAVCIEWGFTCPYTAIPGIDVWGQPTYTLDNQSSRLVNWVQQVQKGQYHDTYIPFIF